MSDIEDLIEQTYDLPAIPVVAQKVITLVRDPETNARDLQDVIQTDPAMTTKILRIANSSLYGLTRKVETLSQAVVIVGFNTIKTLAITTSLKGIYKNYGPVEQAMWEHSVGCALTSFVSANRAGFPMAEEAMIAGLLHDVGKTFMNNNDPDAYKEVCEAIEKNGLRSIEAEIEKFGFDHTQIGAAILRKWNLPEPTTAAVRFHHNLAALKTAQEGVQKLTSLVSLANGIAYTLGFGVRKDPKAIERCISPAQILGFTADGLKTLIEEAATTVERERKIFD